MADAIAVKKSAVFGNTGPAHAAVVLEVMANNSEKSLDIVSGFLDGSVWNSDVLQSFLNRNHDSHIRILLDDIPNDKLPSHSALNRLRRSDRLVVKKLHSSIGAHFCVSDGLHIRLEPSPSSCEASVAFGNQKMVSRIDTLFENMWTKLRDESESSRRKSKPPRRRPKKICHWLPLSRALSRFSTF